MPATQPVILVDQDDRPTGTAEKLEAHRLGLLHRAFSVFIFRDHPTRELLLQKRADGKYHSPGLWTNTCCSHPHPGESVIQAAERRLFEEMGIKTTLTAAGRFHYCIRFENGLSENEVDHVLTGTCEDDSFQPDPAEVQAFRWISLPALQTELTDFPEQFTFWFREALEIAVSL